MRPMSEGLYIFSLLTTKDKTLNLKTLASKERKPGAKLVTIELCDEGNLLRIISDSMVRLRKSNHR